MAIEIQGKVGPQGLASSIGDGSLADPYLGKQAQTIVQDFAPRYAEAAYRGVAFCGSTQAAVAVTNLVVGATGLILINPLGSGKNIFLVDLVIANGTSALATFPTIVLAANTNPVALGSYTLTTPLTIQPSLLGAQSTSVARLLSSATLPVAPVAVRTLWTPQISGSAATVGSEPFVKDEIAGAIGIAPGCAVSLSASAAISLFSSITWIELPQ